MKSLMKCVMIAAAVCMVSGVYAQTAMAGAENPSAMVVAKTPAEVQARDITLTVKNDCLGQVLVFAGSRKEVFDGKGQTLGGHSSNVVYIKEGDVVCIMKGPKTIQACTVAKPGTTKVEINPSGNGFVK
jgi:hypothetical protein